MTAKEYLNQARTLDREIKSKKRELAKIKADSQSLSSPTLGDRVISSHTNNFNKESDMAEDLETRINAEIIQLVELQTELHDRIQKLSKAKHRIVLTDYYVTCMKLEESAESNSYSMSQIKRYFKKAIEEFANYYGFAKDEPKWTVMNPKNVVE